MRPIVVPAVLARLAASAALAFCALASPAFAADRALFNAIGYSGDGRYFAFEEYGVQDGSGFAYSTVYIVDLPADKWVAGTPFHAQAADETSDTPLSEIRAEAMGLAQPRVDALGIDMPAQTLAMIGDGVPNDDGKRLTFAWPQCCGPGQTQEPSASLVLETFPVKPTEDYCLDMNPVGYALTFKGEETAELHRDGATLPKSRGCTLDYRLYGVLAPFEQGGSRVAIVSSYPFGFEGPDRRFLAVPIDR